MIASSLPLAAAQSPDEPPLTDAAGDAVWYSSADLEGAALQACGVGGADTGRACNQVDSPGGVPARPDVGGVPAPAVLDIVSGDVRVEGALVVAELGLASLTDPIAPHGTGDESTYYNLCWRVGELSCRDGFGVSVFRTNGTTQVDKFFFRADERCARVLTCYFEPEVELIPGTPGTIRWTIPHAALPPDTPALVELGAISGSASAGLGTATGSQSYSLSGGDRTLRGWTPTTPGVGADEAVGRETPLGPPASWDPARDRVGSRADEEGDVPAARPDLELLGIALVETDRTLTVATTLSQVDEVPLDHHFTVDMLLTTGVYVTAGYSASQGARATFSGICEPGCGPGTNVPLTRPAEVEIVPGAPGYVNVTFYRGDLGAPGRGDSFNQLFVGALLPEAVRSQDAALGTVYGVYVPYSDFAWDMAPWWFTLGEERASPLDDDVVVVPDPTGDYSTAPSLATLTAELAPFDIRAVRAQGDEPGTFRIELDIDDLSNVAPPGGYTAVFYGVAFNTEQGPIMAGYYDEPESETREFFCAPDTAVIARPYADPQSVIWTPIDGLLSLVRDRSQVAGGATPGSIVFLVPSACFGLGPEEDLSAESLAAATFLFGQRGSMEMVDSAQSEGPVFVAAARAPEPAFYVQPFGIDNFWDITGIAVAAIVALVGAIALRRKQGALRRYLHEIEHVLREHAADARARERALVAIQERVKADLLKNRITESHFVIVERRLDQHLSKVRVQALADVFGDLPHRLLVTLQDLLRDGAMDREDWQLFRTQIAAEAHLSPEARAGIERRVEAWVREHQG